MSTMKAAFAKAGIESPLDRLHGIARKALRDHPRSIDAVRGQIRQQVSGDPALLWALFGRWERGAMDLLVSQVGAQLRKEREKRSGATQAADTTPGPPPQGGGRQAAAPSAADREAARADVVRRLSRLDTVTINKRPIGDCTPEEAYAWADSMVGQARFARALAYGLPPGIPIRRSITPAEADALFERIRQENTNE